METIRYSLISKQDLKLGTGTFEIQLADGRVVSVDEIDIGKLLEQYPVKSYATTSDLPTTDVGAGSLARVTANDGLYIYSGSAWAAVGGSGTHTHAASEITTGALAMAQGGTGNDFSTIAQGYLFYFSATGTLSALAPGAVGQFLKTQGVGANPLWADSSELIDHALGDSNHTDVTITSVAHGDILFRNDSSKWINLAAGTSGQYLQTSGAGANPVWANVSNGLVLDKVTANTTLASSAAETSIYGFSIDGGILDTDGMLRLTIMISDFDAIAGEVFALRFKYGGSTVATITFTADAGTPTVDATAMFQFYLQGDGATNAQRGFVMGRGSGFDGSPTDINGSGGYAQGTSAVDSTAAQNLTVTGDWTTSNASNSITLAAAILERL